MGTRAEGYIRKEITVLAKDADAIELWRCDNCGRWHSMDNGCADERRAWCDACWSAATEEDDD